MESKKENDYGGILSIVLVIGILVIGIIVEALMLPGLESNVSEGGGDSTSIEIGVKPSDDNPISDKINITEDTNCGADASCDVDVNTGEVESKNETNYPEQNPSVDLILNPYELYNPPVKQVNYNGHYVFVVEYFDANAEPCIIMEGVLKSILEEDAVWVRRLDSYDDKVRHDYITKILLGKYYTYYVVPITAIFIDDKLAVVMTGSWSEETVRKVISWYLSNDLFAPGRFLFIDITQALENQGQTTGILINSRVKYNALIDLFLQQGEYKYDRVHALAMSSTS